MKPWVTGLVPEPLLLLLPDKPQSLRCCTANGPSGKIRNVWLWGHHDGRGSRADAPRDAQVEVTFKKRMKVKVGEGGVDPVTRKAVGSSPPRC